MFTEEEVERMMRGWQQKFEELDRMQAALSEVRGTADAADGRIRVVTSPTGELLELHLDPRAMRLASQELSEGILEAAKSATAAAAQQINKLIAPIVSGVDFTELMSEHPAFEMPAEAQEAMETALQELRKLNGR